MVARAVGADDDTLALPRQALRFPVELRIPARFDPDDPGTWPRLDGRLEYVGGRLFYMPPCGEVQQDVCSGVTYVLVAWARGRPEFRVGSNEAGMRLGADRRGADAAVWRRAGPSQLGFSTTPPLLAVEVAGAEEHEGVLRDKARWYLDAGVEVVWLVLPTSREVVVLSRAGERRFGAGQTIEPHASLPGLEPAVDDLFAQLL